MVAILEPRTYLSDWYPGYGEQLVFERLPLGMRQFLSDAAEEYPEFLDIYLVPALQSEDPYEKILNDMTLGLAALDMAEAGLGDFEGNLDGLGKSFFKRLGKTLKKALNPVQAIKGAVKFTERQAKKDIKAFKGVVKGVEKIARKYGAIILTVAGAVLGPFTGGASVAAAAILVAAQKAYQAHAAAAKARKEARKESGQMQAQADAQTAQVEQQVDTFYSQNQSWFESQLGVTPDKWAQLTLQQKIDLINSGTTGQVPPNSTPVSTPPSSATTSSPSGPAQVVSPPDMTASSQPAVTTPSIYGGGGIPSSGGGGGGGAAMPSQGPMPQDAGQDWGNIMPGGAGAQPGQPGQAPQVVESSMFGGGIMLPAAIVTAAVLFTQGKGGGGGGKRRSRRNR